MPKFYRQNRKRIDPRYFLDEITDPKQDPDLAGVGKLTNQDRQEFKEQLRGKDLDFTKKLVSGLLTMLGIPVTLAAVAYTAYLLAGAAILTIIALELLGATEGFKFPRVPQSIDLVAKYIDEVENIIGTDPDRKRRIRKELMKNRHIKKIIKNKKQQK